MKTERINHMKTDNVFTFLIEKGHSTDIDGKSPIVCEWQLRNIFYEYYKDGIIHLQITCHAGFLDRISRWGQVSPMLFSDDGSVYYNYYNLLGMDIRFILDKDIGLGKIRVTVGYR